MNHEQWEAILRNDKRYDGQFFYALSTTKTVCRPSCTARTPNPKNVFIYLEVEKAINKGFRPCNRCKPEQMEWKGYKCEVVDQVKDYLDLHYKQDISLRNLGQLIQKNPYYIQRTFKELIGLTPLHYLHTLRINRAKELLKEGDQTITDIGLELGYSNSAHFSTKFKEFTGMTPSTYRSNL